jgi:hypothetical protein
MEIELIGDWPGEIARTDFARREEPYRISGRR